MLSFVGSLWTRRSLAISLIVLGTAGGVPAGVRADPQQVSRAGSGGPSLPVTTSEPQAPIPSLDPGTPAQQSRKQRQDLLKSYFEKMKRDADELLELAKSLQEDVSKSNENVLSLKIVEKAEKIEKLAKKIKGVAKGF